MAKLTLSDVANLYGNPTTAANTINQNNDRVEAAIENTLSRDGSTPNQMLADFDLNHNDLLNASSVSTDRLYINGVRAIPGQLIIGDGIEVTPLLYGAVGDGVHDDTSAIQAMVNSGAKVVNWLGAEYTWKITTTIFVTDTHVTWYGSATIKMDRHGLWQQPMVVIMQSATNFWSADTLSWDHDMETVPGATRATDLALALGTAFIVMADYSHVGGKFYNSFDVGLAFGSYDFTGDGSVSNPYNVTAQHNANPVACSFGVVYGYNCGCGEHVVSGNTFKQGSAVDVLTAAGVNGVAVLADRCWGGLIVDFASQASCSVGTVITRGTKEDPRLPAASGMGIYNGGFLTVGAWYSDNDQGYGAVCYNSNWAFTVGNAYIFAAARSGVTLGGTGWCSGKFHIGVSGLLHTGDPAFRVGIAGTESIILDVDISAWGAYHGYGYYANNAGTGQISGKVDLYCHQATVANFFTNGHEFVRSHDVNGDVTNYSSVAGRHSFGGQVNNASKALIQIPAGQGIDISGSTVTTISNNLYWDGTNWRHTNTQAGYVQEFNPSTGKMTEYSSVAGTAGAVATLVRVNTRGPSGSLSIDNLGNYANDSAAATGGVPVGGVYRNSNVLQIRIV